MVSLLPKSLSFDDFFRQYGDDPRYELIDGELREMEPTGLHESVAGKLAGRLFMEIFRLGLKWTIPKNCLIRPGSGNDGPVDRYRATALRPDVIVLDEAALAIEPLWERQPVLTSGQAIRLVVEVVSTNWQDDYARKVEEYAALGISEYWIVDFRGLGGIAFIGKPKQPTFTVGQLEGDLYRQRLYRSNRAIVSAVFPEISLSLDDVMP
jgi:Uma2 family endonuclease